MVMTPVPLLDIDREELLNCSLPSSVTYLIAMKAVRGVPPEEMKLREGCAVYQALCTLAVCLSSH